MNIKLNKDNLELVAGAICSVVRHHKLDRHPDVVAGIWSEVAAGYNTYGPPDRLWIMLIKGWEKAYNPSTNDRAYIRVRNLCVKKWAEHDKIERELNFWKGRMSKCGV